MRADEESHGGNVEPDILDALGSGHTSQTSGEHFITFTVKNLPTVTSFFMNCVQRFATLLRDHKQ